MNTHNREDIFRTAGLPLIRDAFAKDMRSLETQSRGKPLSCLK